MYLEESIFKTRSGVYLKIILTSKKDIRTECPKEKSYEKEK